MILNPIKTNDTCIEYFEDDSTAPPVEYYTYTEYPAGYYKDDDFVLPTGRCNGRMAFENSRGKLDEHLFGFDFAQRNSHYNSLRH